MSLAKRTRFILVQSTSNANVTEYNMEPYHTSIFHRSTSMPPLPKLRSLKKLDLTQQEQSQSSSRVVSKYQRREKDEASTNKLYKLNIHTMKKKSARISMRLSNAFGLSAHTIDEQFNFQEQRFRAIEKFLKLFLRNIYISTEALRETFITQVDVAEDFEDLLSDKMPELSQQFVRSKRLLLESIFPEFCNHIELYVVNPLNTLIKLFISPSNLIAKRHNKLLDYDSAQSDYDKVKNQQLKQAKQVLDLSKRTYDVLNNQLLEELPTLYECSYQILSICLKTFVIEHFRLIQQMQINIQFMLNQTISPVTFEQLTWPKILERYISKNSLSSEQFFQLIITGKNFSDKLKYLSTKQILSIINNVDNCDKDISIQTEEIRHLVRNRYAKEDLFTVIRDYTGNQTRNSRVEITVRNGDLVGVINRDETNSIDPNWFVDNGITRDYLPRSILILSSSDNQSNLLSRIPPTPMRRDLMISRQISLPSVYVDYDLPRHVLRRANTASETHLINSSHQLYEENERIYVNEPNCLPSTIDMNESHVYASIDPDDSIPILPTEEERIYIALYDFECTINGVLCLHVGERLKILRYLDDDGNKEWWYVEKINETKQRGYVPANYIQVV